MAVRTKTELRAAAAAMFADNDTGDIVPADARGLLTDVIDTLTVGMLDHLLALADVRLHDPTHRYFRCLRSGVDGVVCWSKLPGTRSLA